MMEEEAQMTTKTQGCQQYGDTHPYTPRGRDRGRIGEYMRQQISRDLTDTIKM